MKSPKVSIVVPVYNGSTTLARLLNSIAAQTFKNFQVLIIDNASTDGTAAISKEMCAKDSRFLYLMNTENMGFQHSYNRGYYTSLGCDYFNYVSCEDYWAPDYMAECVAALEADPSASLAYTYCQLLDGNNIPDPIIKDDFDLPGMNRTQRYLTIISRLGLCTAFYGFIRMSFMQRAFKVFSIRNAAGDTLLLANLALQGPFHEIKRPLFFRQWTNAADESYEDRSARLAKMNGDRGSQTDMPFHYHIIAHLSILSLFDFTPEEKENLCRQTIRLMAGRYARLLEDERRLFIETVVSGQWIKYYGPGEQPPVGDEYRLTYTWQAASLCSQLDYLQWIMPPDAKGLNHAKALLLIYLGRQPEALAALEKELEIQPTFRPALDLKLQLKHFKSGDMGKGAH